MSGVCETWGKPILHKQRIVLSGFRGMFPETLLTSTREVLSWKYPEGVNCSCPTGSPSRCCSRSENGIDNRAESCIHKLHQIDAMSLA